MDSIIHFFVLLISCILCSSHVILFTPDAESNTIYGELLQVNPYSGTADNLDDLSDDAKDEICALIINSPFFRSQGWQYADKRQSWISTKFCRKYPLYFEDHFASELNSMFVVVNQEIKVRNYGYPNLKSFGCLATAGNTPSTYEFHEIFVSSGYVLNTFIISERVNSLPNPGLHYIGVAEISDQCAIISEDDFIIEYNKGNIVVSSRLEEMTEGRRERLCKIVLQELFDDIPFEEVYATYNYSATVVKLSTGDIISLSGKFYCSAPYVDGLKYITVTRDSSDVFILNEGSTALEITGIRLYGIPPLAKAYDY